MFQGQSAELVGDALFRILAPKFQLLNSLPTLLRPLSFQIASNFLGETVNGGGDEGADV